MNFYRNGSRYVSGVRVYFLKLLQSILSTTAIPGKILIKWGRMGRQRGRGIRRSWWWWWWWWQWCVSVPSRKGALDCELCAKMEVLVVQSGLTLCNPMDCIACQAPLPMEFSRQEYWSGLPCPSPGYFPDPGIKPRSPALQADSLQSDAVVWSPALQADALN